MFRSGSPQFHVKPTASQTEKKDNGAEPPLSGPFPPQPRRNMSNSLFDERFGVQQAGGVGGLDREGGQGGETHHV